MPNPALEEAFREACAVAPSGIATLHTFELDHPSFTQPIRVVRNHPDIATWLALGGQGVQDVLDAMAPEDVEQVGLVARLEDGAPNNPGELVAFIALAFDFELPAIENTASPEIMIEMDNVSREIRAALDKAVESSQNITVIYRPFLSDDISTPQWNPPPQLTLFDAKVGVMTVQGRARILDVGNKAFPKIVYDAERFPTLTR
ncbi:hypothetical protein TH9_12170 [Thalassospira xiamenensis]|uniref:DUF1833 family protein n=1 Tax=Thalassospira xiamenensis TaxID=220697 RepID=UPI000DEDF982|nr:DUF1833 family protein [Thalassospira xiamenensis]RCK32484.1 hypothetical protein TH9_12170 [Thalassospira xiamenensis]